MSGIHITYQMTGPNARINNGSQDYSINITNPSDVFSGIKNSIESGVPDNDPVKKDLLAKTTELEQSVNQPTFGQRY